MIVWVVRWCVLCLCLCLCLCCIAPIRCLEGIVSVCVSFAALLERKISPVVMIQHQYQDAAHLLRSNQYIGRDFKKMVPKIRGTRS